MELAWSAAEAAFRDEVRALLDEKLTPELRRAGTLATSVYSDHEASMEWQQILHERGWAAPAWPVEHGGCDWTQTQHYIFGRESVLAGAPTLSPMGIRMVAHAIIAYGTQEQKDFFLPGILTGEVFFCQGYSEPESGSDLASLTMAAVDDGDDLVVTGSKIWTTHATEANWMFALVRTTKSDKKQHGITFVLIDMSTPGVEIRPLVMTSGEEVQNQVFFERCGYPRAMSSARSTRDGRSPSTCWSSNAVGQQQHRPCRSWPKGSRLPQRSNRARRRQAHRRSRVLRRARRGAHPNRGARDPRISHAGSIVGG